jgi:NADH:quinone reductase (non-electrogenic)
MRKLKNTSRLHKNAVSLEVHQLENSKQDFKFDDIAHLMSGKRGATVYTTGDVDAGVWSLGMCAGLIHDVPTCKELAKRLERDAEAALDRSNALRRPSAKL